jgi:hypothetical protein
MGPRISDKLLQLPAQMSGVCFETTIESANRHGILASARAGLLTISAAKRQTRATLQVLSLLAMQVT